MSEFLKCMSRSTTCTFNLNAAPRVAGLAWITFPSAIGE
jgi:hypothetical protein